MLQIDLPTEPPSEPTFVIAGWCAAPHHIPKVQVRVNGRSIELQFIDRPEILAYLPKDFRVIGFLARCDLGSMRNHAAVHIEVSTDKERKHIDFPITQQLKDRIGAVAGLEQSLRATHADWCRGKLACPSCRAKISSIPVGNELLCVSCSTKYAQGTTAINMISPSLRISSNISSTTNVSFNPYEPLALWLIEEVTGKGGWVLDAGAGSRNRRMKNVVNLEIVDYPSTDILAVGENLPFDDNSFDGIVSLAVLEHVKDPMTCAKELMRVLKPGGRIACSVPFLQPVHGYPNHYFNMTQEGLKSLFSNEKILGCFVPSNGHPLLALRWFVREYMSGLSKELGADFARMTLGDVAALSHDGALALPAAVRLDPETAKKISCLNSVLVQKRA